MTKIFIKISLFVLIFYIFGTNFALAQSGGTAGSAPVPPASDPSAPTPPVDPTSGTGTAPAGTPASAPSTPASSTVSTTPVLPKPIPKPTPIPYTISTTPAPNEVTIDEAPLTNEPIPEAPKDSSKNLLAIIAGVLGLGAGGFFAMRTKRAQNKKNKKSDPCGEIKKTVQAKKSELVGVTSKFSIQEALVQKLKKEAEDRAKKRLLQKAKEKTLSAIASETLSGDVKLAEDAKKIYDAVTEKYENAKNLLEALKNTKIKLENDLKTLESNYKQCMLDSATSATVSAGAKKIELFSPTKKHIVIFSHGHGVRKDDLGLLSDIALKIPEVDSVLFDYYDIDEENKIIHIKPFSSQVTTLAQKIKEARKKNKDAIIDIICHSQGSIAPALLNDFSDIRKIIFTAPVFSLEIERTIKRYEGRVGFEFNPEGLSKLPPLDGYVRHSPSEYWKERVLILNVPDLYNKLAEKVDLVMIIAKQDTLVERPNFEELSKKIKILEINGDHQFLKETREPLVKLLRELIL